MMHMNVVAHNEGRKEVTAAVRGDEGAGSFRFVANPSGTFDVIGNACPFKVAECIRRSKEKRQRQKQAIGAARAKRVREEMHAKLVARRLT